MPLGKEKAPDLCEVLEDLIDKNYKNELRTTKYPHTAQTNFQKEIKKKPNNRVSKKGEKLTEHEYSRHSERVTKKFMAMIKNKGEIPEQYKTKKFAQRVLRRRWDSNGPNITATSLPDDFVHFKQPRSLTVREWARLQTFPDWYRFAGKRTTGGLRRAGTRGKICLTGKSQNIHKLEMLCPLDSRTESVII